MANKYIHYFVVLFFILITAGVCSAAVLEGNYDTDGFSLDVAVSGNYAYIADYDNSLVIVDISDPSSPEFVGAIIVRVMLLCCVSEIILHS
jgi:hypothetical protein